MFFVHPMWEHESQRIGMLKCWRLAYNIRAIGELIGFVGLLTLVGSVGCLIYIAVFRNFTAAAWLLLAVPFGMGLVSEIMVQISRTMVARRGFQYDSEKREASWMENGQRVTYRYGR